MAPSRDASLRPHSVTFVPRGSTPAPAAAACRFLAVAPPKLPKSMPPSPFNPGKPPIPAGRPPRPPRLRLVPCSMPPSRLKTSFMPPMPLMPPPIPPLAPKICAKISAARSALMSPPPGVGPEKSNCTFPVPPAPPWLKLKKPGIPPAAGWKPWPPAPGGDLPLSPASPYRSYVARLFSSDRTSYAEATFLKVASASFRAASLLPANRSGCHLSAAFLYAFLMSSAEAVRATSSIV
mmetsp:Transcript_7927/g.26039  ORF Transcript_7927/g.26039 Transcript_7927/m.26039 type:complete len:236 (+) Transcript_7927:861-1568(+)